MSASLPHPPGSTSVSGKCQVPPTVDEDQDLEGLGLSSCSNPEELCDFPGRGGRFTSLNSCFLLHNMGTAPPIFKW